MNKLVYDIRPTSRNLLYIATNIANESSQSVHKIFSSNVLGSGTKTVYFAMEFTFSKENQFIYCGSSIVQILPIKLRSQVS